MYVGELFIFCQADTKSIFALFQTNCHTITIISILIHTITTHVNRLLTADVWDAGDGVSKGSPLLLSISD